MVIEMASIEPTPSKGCECAVWCVPAARPIRISAPKFAPEVLPNARTKF